jgi:hypothetical protein
MPGYTLRARRPGNITRAGWPAAAAGRLGLDRAHSG